MLARGTREHITADTTAVKPRLEVERRSGIRGEEHAIHRITRRRASAMCSSKPAALTLRVAGEELSHLCGASAPTTGRLRAYCRSTAPARHLRAARQGATWLFRARRASVRAHTMQCRSVPAACLVHRARVEAARLSLHRLVERTWRCARSNAPLRVQGKELASSLPRPAHSCYSAGRLLSGVWRQPGSRKAQGTHLE